MDFELLKKALENDDNVGLINTSIQEIKDKKNNILQQLGLNRDDLKMFNGPNYETKNSAFFYKI